MKKTVSLFMTLCIILSLSHAAFAVEVPAFAAAKAGIAIEESAATVSPRAVARGSRATPIRTTVFPAYIDTETNQIMYSSKVYRTAYTPSTSTINLNLYLTTTQTSSLIAEFKAIAPDNRNPDLWIMQTTFEISNDGSGSYGKYFKFKPVGNFAGQLDSDGTVTYDLPMNTAMSYTIDLNTFYFALPDLTQYYMFGLPNGGYYYYNAQGKNILSQMVGSNVCLNNT